MYNNSDKTTKILSYYRRYHCYDNTANNNSKYIKKIPSAAAAAINPPPSLSLSLEHVTRT